ncbi:small cell adhesion glycoprotein homolog [Notolabrus celidotus]|uniref:small cell adhesion glycoprotein homolog n=1 Tax=Notolabrus celidotus TaxID=1203425 RepID=UPI0014901744|nr:small cell adhesion glycoprotein homolog [Notolabrus celidotus]
MDPRTPAPLGWTPAPSSTPGIFTNIVTKGPNTADADFAVLIGGVVSAVLLLLICMIAVLLWCLTRQKGSYVTNEMDEDEDVDEDEESVGSDVALQSKEPLRAKEEE